MTEETATDPTEIEPNMTNVRILCVPAALVNRRDAAGRLANPALYVVEWFNRKHNILERRQIDPEMAEALRPDLVAASLEEVSYAWRFRVPHNL